MPKINEAGRKKKAVEDETTLGDKVEEIVDQAEETLDEPVVEEDPDLIFRVLDHALAVNRENVEDAIELEKMGEDPGYIQYQNVLLIGEAGTGKTARVEAWAKSRGINLVLKKAGVMDELDLGGGVVKGDNGKMMRLSTDEFDDLDEVANSVLFLDELNRSAGKVRGAFLTLIQNHTLTDGRKQRLLKEMAFTIAAINPSDAQLGYDVEPMDPAELSRFRNVTVVSDPKEFLSFVEKEWRKKLLVAKEPKKRLKRLRQLELARKLLTNKNFKFDGPEDIARLSQASKPTLQNRSLMALLDSSNGTKQDFLNMWPEYCNPFKWQDIKAMLADYEDPNLDDFEEVDDKATQVLKKKPEEAPAEEAPSAFKKGLTADEFQSIINKKWGK